MAENKWVTGGISPRNKWNYGPLLVITRVINPISREKQPELPIYFRPFVGVMHTRIYNWFFGAPLWHNNFPPLIRYRQESA